MKNHNNRNTLMNLMRIHNVSISQVAGLLGKQANTIRVYRCLTGRDIPSSELERLQYKLNEKPPISEGN